MHGVSRTSIYVAAGRAVGAREPDPAVRNPDYLAEKLLGDPSMLDVDHPAVRALSLSYDEAMQHIDVVNIVRVMAVRTRFIDEALARAIAAGAAQVVILGAGFDSHAYRFQELLAQVRVFEVDRPVTQALKQERVNAVLGTLPANLTYVPADFQHETLPEVLKRHGHDRAQRTFFILEGVTMYLQEEAVRDTLRFIGAHPPGSSVVFDFVYRTMIDAIAQIDMARVPDAQKPFLQRFLDLIKDEPWVFGMPMDGEAAFLRECGLALREVFAIGGDDSIKRYLTRADGREVGEEVIAAAIARMTGDASAPPSPEARARMRARQRVMSYQLAEATVGQD
jgi:methyltransferase (TIGR00027 family)